MFEDHQLLPQDLEEELLAPALVALYLRGLGRPLQVVRHRWRTVEGLLRAHAPARRDLPAVLRRAGFEAEALVVESPGVWSEAVDLLEAQKVATPYHAAYPQRWVEVLGHAAPPAVWSRGGCRGHRWVAVVGSRRAGKDDREFAGSVARLAAGAGWGVVSGGAAGCDRAALDAEPDHSMEILPCGFSLRGESACAQCTVCGPDEPFSTATAMERNALVYAAGSAAVVVRVELKSGGTWHGAVDALRRRLTRVGVRTGPNSPGAEALAAIGASRLTSPDQVFDLLAPAPVEPLDWP